MISDDGIGSWYAGIGSRETPSDVLGVMFQVAIRLAGSGWGLRSGGAPGADTWFEKGASLMDAPLELYLPWPGFEDRKIGGRVGGRDHPSKEAFALAAEHHPAWLALKPGARALHARNCHQILGPDIDNPVLSRFVLCWTPEASGRGGTGQAIRVAKHFGVPVYDLADPKMWERVGAFVMKEETLL